MIYICSFLNSNGVLYVIIGLLLIVSLILLYLLHTQEMNNYDKRNDMLNKDNIQTDEDWKDDKEELQNISKTLGNLPKEKTIVMNDFELEQEEKAIISYDELVRKANNEKDIIEDRKEPNKRDYGNYRHEEEYLEYLKGFNDTE